MVEGLQIIKNAMQHYMEAIMEYSTQAKIWQCGFFWLTMYEDTKGFI
jgi:hypothetical protein